MRSPPAIVGFDVVERATSQGMQVPLEAWEEFLLCVKCYSRH